MADAGYKVSLLVSEDDVTYVEVDGLKNFSLPIEREALDTTNFKTPGIDRTMLMGLRNVTISCSGDRVQGDPGQEMIEDRLFDESDDPFIWVKILIDGTNGYKCKMCVPSEEINSEIEGLTGFSASFNQNGTFSRVS